MTNSEDFRLVFCEFFFGKVITKKNQNREPSYGKLGSKSVDSETIVD